MSPDSTCVKGAKNEEKINALMKDSTKIDSSIHNLFSKFDEIKNDIKEALIIASKKPSRLDSTLITFLTTICAILITVILRG